MPKTTLNLRVDSELKKDAEKVINKLGISMSSAIVLYLNALIRENGIPFDIKANNKQKAPAKKEAMSKKIAKPAKKENAFKDNDIPDFDSIKAALSKL